MEGIGNNDLLQTVFDSASNGIAVMQSVYNSDGSIKDFAILLFNAYTLNWIGDVDYKGKLYGDVFPMVKETGILNKFIEVATTGISANFETKYTGEGMNHWFRFTAVKQGELLVVTTEDISESKQTQLALNNALDAMEKQQRLYNSITNNTPDLVYVFDLDYRFTYANKALLTMWGKSAEEAIGKGLRENGYEEWHALMHEREIDDIVANQKNIRGTVSFPHAEFGRRIYDYILVPVINEQGQVEAIAGTTRDITDIKQVEEKLQRSEARFRNLLQEAPIAATLFQGPDLVVEIANELTLKYWGKSKSIIGKPVAEAVPELEDQQMIALLNDMYKRGGVANFSEVPITFLHDGISKIGYYSYSLKTLYDSNGNAESILSTGVDVTEQVVARQKIEESEARLKSVIDQTPAPTLVLRGDELAIEQVNQPMLQLLGRGGEVIGQPLIDILPELQGQYVWQQVQRVYKEGISFDQSEVLVPHSRGGAIEDHYYNLAYRPLKENGVITGMIQVAIDVTAQVVARQKVEESESRYRTLSETLEQQVKERTKELQRSNEDLQQFAHVASHDLKEPVRKIKTFTDRLERNLEGKLDDDAIKYVERIHTATDRMFTMIDGVLTYSTTNAVIQSSEDVDLNEVLKNIETDLEVILQSTSATITSSTLPALQGAPILLYQLFYNLINNSIKFVAPGMAPQITISSEPATVNGDHCARITLSDNGIGFEAEYAERIFDTFTRLNSKDKYEGTGLGLALCKKIVERHGGTIAATGNPGIGATFIIILPMQQKQATV